MKNTATMLKTVWHHKKLDIMVKASYTPDMWEAKLRQIEAHGDEVISVEVVLVSDLLPNLNAGRHA